MTSHLPELLVVGSPNDLICAAIWQLGFMPADSVLVICLHGERRRVGLVMRFDLAHPGGELGLVDEIGLRVAADGADRIVLAIFSPAKVTGRRLPLGSLVDGVVHAIDVEVDGAFFVDGNRWWSYFAAVDPRQAGSAPLDFGSPAATNVGAAFALAGHRVLPDREAVFRSVQCGLADEEQGQAVERILRARLRHRKRELGSLRLTMRRLAAKLVGARVKDPRSVLTSRDAAELAALAFEPIVRDEVLVMALHPDGRKGLLAVLGEIVRRTPPPVDAPVCSMLAWVAYVEGDGVVASLCVDRALLSNPAYSLATLIDDALHRQIPPRMLAEVMEGAARDLRTGDTAG